MIDNFILLLVEENHGRSLQHSSGNDIKNNMTRMIDNLAFSHYTRPGKVYDPQSLSNLKKVEIS